MRHARNFTREGCSRDYQVAGVRRESGNLGRAFLGQEYRRQRGGDTTRSEAAEFIAGLNDDEQANLVALTWVGRGTYSAEEFKEAVEMARAERTNPTQEYLLGIPLLADYLEEGLEKLGYSVEDVENDML